MVWQNKNNKLSFINLNNPVRLNAESESIISLSDVQTKSSFFGVYDDFNWSLIEKKINKFQNKYYDNIKNVNYHNLSKLKQIF